MNDENNLTIDWEELEGILEGIQVDTTSVELYGPLRASEIEGLSFLVLEQMGLCRLSEETRQREEERLAKLLRKRRALRERKPYTRKRGHVHPKKKAATLKRRRERRWRRDPYSCLINGWGYWKLDKAMFEEHVMPLWRQHPPAELSVKKTAKGTAKDPHTIFNIQIMHREHAVFDGSSLELYLLSSRLLPADIL